MPKHWIFRILLMVLITLPTAGCMSTSDRLPAVPRERAIQFDYLGIPDSRFHLTSEPERFATMWIAAERKLARSRPSGWKGTEHMLALSGGGDNGAYGAGILYGWSQRGDRPEFTLVTGVSTGALIASFAFLGTRYDEALKAVYTQITESDIATKRPILAALVSDALADTGPLTALIARHLTEDMMREIAQEYRKGRLLLIGTTDLDLAQPVIWNIGAIADSGHPDALASIRRVLLASASIPGVFPPVPIEVDVDGQKRHELHVDGGATNQVFLYPSNIPMRALPEDIRRTKRVAWVIRNGRTLERAKQVDRGLMPVAQRSISTLIAANAMGDLYRMYLTTQRDKIDFNLAYMTRRFAMESDKPFDPAYMNALFEFGRTEAVREAVWAKRPPGYTP
jgi:predicted acylesterase/phospholipase RssA